MNLEKIEKAAKRQREDPQWPGEFVDYFTHVTPADVLEMCSLIRKLNAEVISLGNLHVLQAAAVAAVTSVESLETSEGEALPYSGAALVSAIVATAVESIESKFGQFWSLMGAWGNASPGEEADIKANEIVKYIDAHTSAVVTQALQAQDARVRHLTHERDLARRDYKTLADASPASSVFCPECHARESVEDAAQASAPVAAMKRVYQVRPMRKMENWITIPDSEKQQYLDDPDYDVMIADVPDLAAPQQSKQRHVYDWLTLVETKIGTPTASAAARVLKEFYEGAEPDPSVQLAQTVADHMLADGVAAPQQHAPVLCAPFPGMETPWTEEKKQELLDVLSRYEPVQQHAQAARPYAFVIVNEHGDIEFCTKAHDEAQEHINDAISDHDIEGAGKWRSIPVFEMRPTDDALWDQTLRERDDNHDMADKLADAIAEYFGANIGEHSSANCPWAEALRVIEEAKPRPTAPVDAELPSPVDDPIDLAVTLRMFAGDNGYSHNDYADVMRQAAEQIERSAAPLAAAAQRDAAEVSEPQIDAAIKKLSDLDAGFWSRGGTDERYMMRRILNASLNNQGG